MASGCKELYTPVVFNLTDLREIYKRDSHGKKGMWAFHSKYHSGHGQCAKYVNKKCDWVVGILWNNFAAGMRWMLGDTIDVDGPIRAHDIEVLKRSSDVVMVFTGDYHPYDAHWYTIKSIIDKEFPESFLKEKGITEEFNIYSSLIYSIAIRLTIHEIYGIHLDYHASCGRDRWRHVKYKEWVKERFNLELELLDAVRDEYGNVISGMRNRVPDKYNKRIKKPLLLPKFNTLEEVNDYIKDIPDLKAVHFAKEYGWIHVKFEFAGKYWWSEGLKLWKS
jgi:hypothetical protein